MKKTEIIIMLDRSGSMERIASDMEGGFERFIKDQQAVEGEAFVTLAQFDDQYELVYEKRPLAEVERFELKPRNATALYDAIGFTVARQMERIDQEKWADVVVAVIITDGLENASREYDQQAVQSLVKRAEAKNWEFVYMGANQDAVLEASKMGMKMGSGRNYRASSQGTRDMYADVSATTTSRRSGRP